MATGTVTPPATAAPGTAVAPVQNRFVAGSARHAEPFYDSGAVAAGVSLDNIPVAANGFLRSILVRVDIASSGNSATVALKENSPFDIIKSVRLADINGANLFGPMRGIEWAAVHKYGGYRAENRPRLSPVYAQATTGAGATAGTGSFMLRIPVEVNPRDAFGALPNMNAASSLKLYFTLGALTDIFSTAPNGTVTVRVRASIETWLVPGATDQFGRVNKLTPPAVGSYQRWIQNTFNVVNGANTFQLENVSNNVRMIILMFESPAGTRNDANFPATLQLNLDGYTRDSVRSDELRQRMFEDYGYTEPVAASGTGIQTGEYVWQWADELDGRPGFETRELYLPTNSATRFELVGPATAAGVLTVLWNDIVIPNDARAEYLAS